MTNFRHRVIAIDGPAASGKSSVARELARRLGFSYVHSGGAYRAATYYISSLSIPFADEVAVLAALESANFVCELNNKTSCIRINGEDMESHLIKKGVNEAVSQLAALPGVRTFITKKLRSYAAWDDVVMEGRDIGSVVFPDTPFKFYLDASEEVRLRRRISQGIDDAIRHRDRIDSSRAVSPLVIAEGAPVIDNSDMTVDEVVEIMINRLKTME